MNDMDGKCSWDMSISFPLDIDKHSTATNVNNLN